MMAQETDTTFMEGAAAALPNAAVTDGEENPSPENEETDAQHAAMADLPMAVQNRLLLAEAKSIGAELGLRDAEAALKLLTPGCVTVQADGEVTGMQDALEALKQNKVYMFAAAPRGAWAQKVSGAAVAVSGVEEAFYRKNPALRK